MSNKSKSVLPSLYFMVPTVLLWGISLVVVYNAGLKNTDRSLEPTTVPPKRDTVSSIAGPRPVPTVRRTRSKSASIRQVSRPLKKPTSYVEDRQPALQAAEIVSGPDSVSGTIAFAQLLERIDEHGIRRALDQLSGTPATPGHYRKIHLLLQKWGALNAYDAIEYVRDISDQSNVMPFLKHVFSGWAAVDPDAAIAWIEDKDNIISGKGGAPLDNTALLAGFVAGFAEYDPAAAEKYMLSLPQDENIQGQLADVLANHHLRSGAEAAEYWIDRLPPGKTREVSTLALADKYAEFDPRAAADWAYGLDRGRRIKCRILSPILTTWIGEDIAGAADWIIGREKYNAQSITQITRMWGARDPDSTAEWLCKLSDSPERDRGIESFAFTVSDANPAYAIDWANAISAESLRTKTVLSIYDSWRQKEPEAADAFFTRQE